MSAFLLCLRRLKSIVFYRGFDPRKRRKNDENGVLAPWRAGSMHFYMSPRFGVAECMHFYVSHRFEVA